MKLECAYSFSDLYIAAHGKPPERTELDMLYALSQVDRNTRVREWAQQAGWGVEERVGSDGTAYTAFCPLWKPKAG